MTKDDLFQSRHKLGNSCFFLGILLECSENVSCLWRELMYNLGDFIEMKKPHACLVKSTGKKANKWEIMRLGADIKIRCSNCDHLVMMPRNDFNKKIKKILN